MEDYLKEGRAVSSVNFETVASHLYAVGDRVAADLTQKFEAAKAIGSPEIHSQSLGFAAQDGTLGENNSRFLSAPIKYAIDVRDHVALLAPTLPFFKGLKSVYEIGVGPGYMMRLLIDLYGIEVAGCDIEINERGVYKTLRDALGLSEFVIEHRVEAFQAIPIPKGAEAVIAYSSVFDKFWGVEEYRAFLADCNAKLTGPKRIIWRLNRFHNKPPVRSIIARITTTPFADHPVFRVTDLNTLSPTWWQK